VIEIEYAFISLTPEHILGFLSYFPITCKSYCERSR